MSRANLTRRTLVGIAAVLPATAAAQEAGKAQGKSPARTSAVVVPFDTAGHLDASGDFWHVPSEIWAYRPQDSHVRKRVIASLFSAQYGLSVTDANRAVFDRRINLLLADNAGGVRPDVRIGSEVAAYPPTGVNGHTSMTVELPIYPATPVTGARIPLDVDAATKGRVHLIPAEGVSVISDLDDTVKDTGVLEKRRLWESTFFLPFKAVPGMADLVTRLAGSSGGVHYVSSTPWHLYTPIREWLATDAFPVSSLHLKQIRLKDSTIFDILKGPEVMKPPVIAGLIQRWPKRTFILLGDSGEKDPEVYADAAKRFPNQVARILIRRAPGDASAASRFTEVFAGIERSKWQVFDTAADVTI